MGGTNRIDIQRFHQLNILSHRLLCQGPSILRVILMTVYAGKRKDLPVDTKSCIIRIGIRDLDLAEAHS